MPPVDPYPATRRNGIWEVVRDLRLPFQEVYAEDSQYVSVNSGALSFVERYGHPDLREVDLPGTLFAVRAGDIVEINHVQYQGAVLTPDLERLNLRLILVADIAGVPVGQTQSNFVATRAGNVVSLPASSGNWTVAAASTSANGFKVTATAGGWYQIFGYSRLTET